MSVRLAARLALAALGTTAAACGAADPHGGDTEASALPIENMTCGLAAENGLAFNGLSTNGLAFNGLTLNGLSANGLSINGLTSNGLSINGLTSNGVTLNGRELNGSHLNGLAYNGQTSNGITVNGREINGLSANGLVINGLSANGLVINGVTLNGLTLNGLTLDGVTVDGRRTGVHTVDLRGSELALLRAGEPVEGVDFAGAVLRAGETEDGEPIEIRVERVERVEGDHVSYAMAGRVGDAAWTPLCADAEGRPDASRLVTLLRGGWDVTTGDKVSTDRVLTLACDGYAIAKCVHFGYAPWRGREVCADGECREVSLEAHHQACTRMLRADYCGDGAGHTVDGTLVNLYDGVGLQSDAGGEGWTLEAEWGANGATCLNSTRIAALSDGCTTPCLEKLRRDPLPDCGSPEHLALTQDPWTRGQTLIVTEHPAHASR